MQITRKLRKNKLSLSLLLPAVIISILGILTLYFTDPAYIIGSDSLSNIVLKQIIFLIIGVFVFWSLSKFDFEYLKFRPLIILLYVATLILLILTLFFGETVKGAQRWITIAGIQLQPSELAKLTVIIVTAFVLNLQTKFKEYVLIIASFLLTLPILVLVYLQPHGSMTLILMGIWAVTVFFSLPQQFRNFLMLMILALVSVGIWGAFVYSSAVFYILIAVGLVVFLYSFFSNNGWQIIASIFFVIAIVGGLISSYSWNSILLPYQKERVTSFLAPDSADPNSTFNVDQAKIAIGSGQIFGKGWGNSTQASREFLPEHQTDFIFASYAEQTGLVGGIVLIALYSLLLFSIFMIPIKDSSNIYAATIVVAIGVKILIEVFINLGTNLGVTPATGIPLPLMSAGGSVTLVTFFSLGLIQSIMNRRSFIDN